MKNLVPKRNQLFKVTFRNSTDSFYGMIVSVDNKPVNSDRQYKVSQTRRMRYDAAGRPYKLPNQTIEVEKNWFNTELTGRIIKII